MLFSIARRLVACALIALLAAPLYAESTLPIKQVVLYKHGIGYFEREGAVDGKGDIALEFKASEMSDVLKSLTLLTTAGAVHGVSYEASDPLSKQLAEFPFALPADASLGQVMDQFKGARLDVKLVGGGEAAGSILGVHRAIVEKNESEILSLVTDGGEFRSIAMRDIAGLRFDDPHMQQQLDTYLQLLRTSHRRDLRLLRVHPGAARDLAVSYVVEAPVWKSSYRLVLDDKNPKEALLQGWAIVDNTSAEDWKNVQLSLVSGLPVSFTQNLYQAHYINRPNVPLPSEMAAAPIAHEGAVDMEAKDERGGVAGGVGGPVKMANRQQFQRTQQYNVMAKAMEMSAPAAMPVAPPAAPSFDRAVNVDTTGREVGELFEYRIDHPVDIPHNQSAMIPFVQTPVKVDRVLFYSPGAAGSHPYDAVLLVNTSGKTLDGGAITVLDGSQYAGESLMETMKAGDDRPVTFAVDLGTRITTAFDSRDNVVYSVKVRRGSVFTKAKNVSTNTYTVRNTDSRAKKLVIEHPVRAGWKLVGDSKPFETSAQHYRFMIDAPAQQTAKLKVEEEYEISSSYAVANITPDLMVEYAQNKALSAAGEKALKQLFALKDLIAQAQNDARQQETDVNEMFRDQDRLRQNINNLRGLAGQQEQVSAYAAKLVAQEKQVEAKKQEQAATRVKLRQLQQQLDQLMNTMSFE